MGCGGVERGEEEVPLNSTTAALSQGARGHFHLSRSLEQTSRPSFLDSGKAVRDACEPAPKLRRSYGLLKSEKRWEGVGSGRRKE